jgi:hypothetical protein
MPSTSTKTLEDGLYTLMLTKTDLVAAATGGIYPDIAPQDASFPRVVYIIPADKSFPNMAAAGNLNRAQVQIDVYALSSASRGALVNIIKADFDGKQALLTTPVQIETMALDDSRRSIEEPENNSDSNIYRCMMEWTVWYRDPAK